MIDSAWIDLQLRTARPRAIAALLRYFDNVELAEEAFQEASLRALSKWPQHGAPRDPLAWLILVGRNAAIDTVRRQTRVATMSPELESLIDNQAEERIAEELETAEFGDDMIRLLFICCHRSLSKTQQIALALRVVSGLSVARIARAFLVSEAAMEQRITRAKRALAQADVLFETPSRIARIERLTTVLSMLYLMFNEGYSASAREMPHKGSLCDEAIRLGRLLIELCPGEPEVLGLVGLMLLQQSRAVARFDADGMTVLLEEQDRACWDRACIVEGTSLVDRAFAMGRPGPYQIQAAIAALHARAPSVAQTDWPQIERLYRALAEFQPTPVVALNHAVAVWQVAGPQAALDLVEPLNAALQHYFYFHAVHGQLLDRLGRFEEARMAYSGAMNIANSAAEAAQIRILIDRLDQYRPLA
ncbi:RNA polymerase sigma factor [Sphingobium sp. Sx8-8]|uniref:RNA polymerase sigma factor n=1 Tax=Sphingobium sp. Sx8-8 TaxID=2933617 RepID=UPI001F59BE1F|nr:RNA polymerase sigma factor [Sphingobium sp. Sx8-8]